MIQLRRWSHEDNEEYFTDITKTQLELVTNDGIYQLLGMKGIFSELRSENNIFDASNETVDKLSNPIGPFQAEIYMGSEESDYDRYTIAFTGQNMAKLYGVPQEHMFQAVAFVADFLADYVSPDRKYLPVIEPDQIGLMCLTAYWAIMKDNNVCSTGERFRKAFDYALANCVVTGYGGDVTWGLDKPLPDYSNPYARFVDVMKDYEVE